MYVNLHAFAAHLELTRYSDQGAFCERATLFDTMLNMVVSRKASLL